MSSCDRSRPPGAACAAAALALLALAGCRNAARRSPKAPTATTTSRPASTASSRRFEDQAHGFALLLPEDWERKPSDDPQAALDLRRPGGSEMSVVVPKLPPHVPGLIPLRGVQSGYVHDVRRHWTGVTVTDESATSVGGVPARRFEIAGADKTGAAKKMQVLVFAREDVLYIVSAQGPAAQFDAVRSAEQRLAASWSWLKKETP